jgi:hypothetical protein
MDRTLTYALITGVAVVVLAVILKAALRWAFKLVAFLLVLAALAGGTWLWFNYSNQPSHSERSAGAPRRATPAQH